MINPQHITLACTFFQDLGTWVTKNTRELELRERVEICMEGLMLVLPERLTSEDLTILALKYTEFKSAAELAKLLEGMVVQIIGAGPYVIGFDSWSRAYDGSNGVGGCHRMETWKRLVAKFMM